jgi:hypothetical protein
LDGKVIEVPRKKEEVRQHKSSKLDDFTDTRGSGAKLQHVRLPDRELYSNAAKSITGSGRLAALLLAVSHTANTVQDSDHPQKQELLQWLLWAFECTFSTIAVVLMT